MLRPTALVSLLAGLFISGQGSAQGLRYKGVLTPVSYGEDVELNDVFFVTVDEGWVTGGRANTAGVLLHTTDGGANWTVALGDPSGSQRPFFRLRFVDRTTGFVAQRTGLGDHTLLRTTDGDHWTVTGTVPQHSGDYRFVSSTTGVASTGKQIVRTTDAGRTWSPVFDCALKVQVNGLARATTCDITAFAFPTPNVGYALGGAAAAKGMYVFKTTDGGVSWSGGLAVPGDEAREGHIFFTNERSGYACLAGGKLFGTDDGGATWTGLPGASCESKAAVLFADPEVGWTLRHKNLTFTTDGGRRWTSSTLALPAFVNAFSLPRRDRAYVVGDHGMVFRYSVVAEGAAVGNAVAAPAMPVFSTAIAEKGNDFELAVTSVEQTLGGAAADAGKAQPGGAAAAEPMAPFIAACCGKRLSSLELVLRALNALVPTYAEKYRNLNLVALGLRTADALPGRADELKAAVKAFRTASDRAAADQALATIKTTLSSFRAVADTALQKTP